VQHLPSIVRGLPGYSRRAMSQRPSPLSLRDPWDLVAAGYAAEVERVMRPIARRVVRFVDERAPGVLDASAVVDVACGPGTLALELAPRVRRHARRAARRAAAPRDRERDRVAG
jgi:hypothetical protein